MFDISGFFDNLFKWIIIIYLFLAVTEFFIVREIYKSDEFKSKKYILPTRIIKSDTIFIYK